MVRANAAGAETVITKFDSQLRAVNEVAKKGVNARLGGTLNPEAFKAYEQRLSRAARMAKDRAAFKAELGANFNNNAFNAYERAVDKAERSNAKLAAAQDVSSSRSAKFGNAMGGLGSRLVGVATLAAGASLGLAAIGKSSLDSAVKFQQGMELIHTQAGATQKEVEGMTSAVQAMARSVGTGPNALATGLYHLESQGLRSTKALNALRVAAQGARVGNANLEDVTNALGAAVVSGIKGVQNLHQAMGALNAVVGSGDMRMQDLADALGTGILGPMKQFGLSLTDVGAALAVFGDNNIRGADAATKLSSAIRIMAAPSIQASKALKGIGIGTTQLADDMRSGGLVKAFEDLQQHLHASGKTASEQALVISRAFGGRQATGVQLLLGQLERLRTKERDVAGGAGKFGEAWNATRQTLAFQLDQLRATFETLGITIGRALAPMVPVLNRGAQAVTLFVQQMQQGVGAGGRFASIIGSIGSFAAGLFRGFQQGNAAIVAAVGAVGGLVVALKAAALAEAAFNLIATANPYVLLAGAIGALVGALVLLYVKVGAVRKFISDAWIAIRSVAQAVFPVVARIAIVAFDVIKVALNLLVAAFKIAWAIIGPVVLTPIGIISAAVRTVLIPAFNAVKGPVGTLGSVVGTIFSGIRKAVGGAIDFILGAFSSLLRVIATVAGVNIPLLGHVFGSAAGNINRAADSVDALRRQLEGLPARKSTSVDVSVNFASNIAGAISSIGQSIGGAISNVGTRVGGGGPGGTFATGGMVNEPGYFAGEEAPRHPEVIIATNPKYRQRNLGLFATAGRMLGVPGFAAGGLANAGRMVGAIDPWTAQHASSWMRSTAGRWAQQFAGMLGGGTPGAAGGPEGVTTYRGLLMADWVAAALQWAARKGVNPQPTSGYRPGFDPHTATGTSEHQGTRYPHGAVDFGGMIDPAALPKKLAVVAATRDFKWPLLAPMGFRDDGHASGTGHWRGGIWGKVPGFARHFAQGGIIQGPVSTFGPPLEAAGRTAFGRSSADAGISLRIPGTSWGDSANRRLMGKLFDVMVGAHRARLMDIDLGPADWTGRNIDVTGAGSRLLGIDPAHFPTGAVGRAIMVAAGGKGAGASTKAAKATPKFPTGAVWAQSTAANGPGGSRGRRLGDLLRWAGTWQAKLLGMPAPPTLPGAVPDTVAGAGRVQARLSAASSLAGALGSKAQTLASFYGIDNNQLVDANGNVDTNAVKRSLEQLDVQIRLAQQIFHTWQLVVSLSQRLVYSNQLIIRRLQDGLRGISTKGLKGARLKAAQARIAATRQQISTFRSNLASAEGNLSQNVSSRDQSWIDLLTLRHNRQTVASTTPATSTAASVAGPVDTGGSQVDSQTSQLLSQLLTQANQRFAVSQAQYAAGSPFVGAFQAGGMTSRAGWALVGEQGPELAHLPSGTRIMSHDQSTAAMAQPNIVVQVLDGAVDSKRIRVYAGEEAEKAIRRTTRRRRAPLPGAGGG